MSIQNIKGQIFAAGITGLLVAGLATPASADSESQIVEGPEVAQICYPRSYNYQNNGRYRQTYQPRYQNQRYYNNYNVNQARNIRYNRGYGYDNYNYNYNNGNYYNNGGYYNDGRYYNNGYYNGRPSIQLGPIRIGL